MNGMKCQTCRWWRKDEVEEGWCHLNPSTTMKHKDSRCSHWEPKTSLDDIMKHYTTETKPFHVDNGTITNDVWTVEWKRDGATVAFKLSPTMSHEIKLPDELARDIEDAVRRTWGNSIGQEFM